MASSVCVRTFLEGLDEEAREEFHPLLLPRMVLNRYYVAEGVRLYSQQTWAQLYGEAGKGLVEKHMAEVVAFYADQADAANHAVREAACACIAELGLKVDRECVRPHVPQLVDVLLDCFQDESWPVRDASCVASGRFIRCFPDECRRHLADFNTLFFHHLADNIWSVREDAAVALGAVVEAYGDAAFEAVYGKFDELLARALVQEPASTKNAGLTNATLFGVAAPVVPTEIVTCAPIGAGGSVRRTQYAFGADDPLHENQQVYSCGSLAPKLKKKKKKRAPGCMDCEYARPPEPWEGSDGAVYLMREMATSRPAEMADKLPVLISIAQVRTYAHHHSLLQTVWKQLPTIAERVGKKAFKAHFEGFIEPLHYSLVADNHLGASLARDCVGALAKLLGPSILKGRIEIAAPDLLPAFEPTITQRR